MLNIFQEERGRESAWRRPWRSPPDEALDVQLQADSRVTRSQEPSEPRSLCRSALPRVHDTCSQERSLASSWFPLSAAHVCVGDGPG